MWGQSFTDFAKAAQNLQEQAAAAADVASSTLATPTSLFNLDSMQAESEKAATPEPAKVEVREEPVKMTKSNALSLSQIAPAKQMTPPRAANGKLKVPSTSKLPAPAVLVSEEKEASNKSQLSDETSPKNEGSDGWDDNDDDLDFDEDEEAENLADGSKVDATSLAEGGEQTGTNIETEELCASIEQYVEENATSTSSSGKACNSPPANGPVVSPNVDEVTDEEKSIIKEDEPEEKVEMDHEESHSSFGPVEPDKVVPMDNLQTKTSHPIANPGPVVPVRVDDTNSAEDVKFTTALEERNIELDPENETASVQAEGDKGVLETDEKELPKPETATEEAESTKTEAEVDREEADNEFVCKPLVLCSINSMNKTAQKRQERLFTILKSRQIPYESIDGADPQHKSWRDELFDLCGRKGEYPQIFLLRLKDGSTSYWGSSDRLEFANDSGTLHDELTGQLVTEWSPRPMESSRSPQPMESPQPNPKASEPTNNDAASIESEAMLEQFAQQMKRVEENHAAEMTRVEDQHAADLASLEEKHRVALEAATTALSHDACIAQESLQESFKAKMDARDEEFHELLRTNEGMKLKLDMLQREVTGTQQLLEARDTDMGEANESFTKHLRELEQKLIEAEQKSLESNKQAQEAKKSVDTAETDLLTSRQELADLKARVKVVAGELKERRVECRELKAVNEKLSTDKVACQETIDELQSRLTHQNRSGSDQQEQMEQLKAELVDASSATKDAEARIEDVRVEAEKKLEDYKRKAQHSLSMANARIAAATQAKEEAELEARAARNTADTSMDRAVKAEISSKEALAEAKAFVSSMQSERDGAVKELAVLQTELASSQQSASELTKEVNEMMICRDETSEQLREARLLLSSEQDKVNHLETNASVLDVKVTELKDQTMILRDQLNRAEKEVAVRSVEDPTVQSTRLEDEQQERDANDETIRMLQSELRHANVAIEDLKEALKNAVEMGSEPSVAPTEQSSDDSEPSHVGNEATPLYFAMEKQAELKTARNEINRLANLLADVQSEKTEAVDAMKDMRKKADEAESKLQRFEKLRPRSHDGKPNEGSSEDSGSTNIEYLKNIMLRFLNAKTLAEKKALVPVVGAVLCLTPEEQVIAMTNVEEASSLGGVGQTFFESFTGRLS